MTAKKRSYGRLKKEIAEQDAVLEEYLMQHDKREAERDKKADEREKARVQRANEQNEKWLTSLAQTFKSTMAMALAGNSNKRHCTSAANSKSHGESN